MEKGAQHLQFKGRFILTSVKSGLMLIDQHRAHVRVLFDRYMNQIRQKQGVSQGVLFPEIVQLPASEAAVLESLLPGPRLLTRADMAVLRIKARMERDCRQEQDLERAEFRYVAPRSGALVRVEDMRDSYWSKRFTGARRADVVANAAALPSVR